MDRSTMQGFHEWVNTVEYGKSMYDQLTNGDIITVDSDDWLSQMMALGYGHALCGYYREKLTDVDSKGVYLCRELCTLECKCILESIERLCEDEQWVELSSMVTCLEESGLMQYVRFDEPTTFPIWQYMIRLASFIEHTTTANRLSDLIERTLAHQLQVCMQERNQLWYETLLTLAVETFGDETLKFEDVVIDFDKEDEDCEDDDINDDEKDEECDDEEECDEEDGDCDDDECDDEEEESEEDDECDNNEDCDNEDCDDKECDDEDDEECGEDDECDDEVLSDFGC